MKFLAISLATPLILLIAALVWPSPARKVQLLEGFTHLGIVDAPQTAQLVAKFLGAL